MKSASSKWVPPPQESVLPLECLPVGRAIEENVHPTRLCFDRVVHDLTRRGGAIAVSALALRLQRSPRVEQWVREILVELIQVSALPLDLLVEQRHLLGPALGGPLLLRLARHLLLLGHVIAPVMGGASAAVEETEKRPVPV